MRRDRDRERQRGPSYYLSTWVLPGLKLLRFIPKTFFQFHPPMTLAGTSMEAESSELLLVSLLGIYIS